MLDKVANGIVVTFKLNRTYVIDFHLFIIYTNYSNSTYWLFGIREDAYKVLQIVFATMLFLCMTFGIGFIINMLVKTTWFPTYFFIVLIIILALWAPWSGDNQKLIDVITQYTIVDFIPIVGAIIGAILSGTTIKALRKGGYQMF